MGYYGLSFNTNNLGGSRFMNAFIAGVVEIPGTVLCYVLLRKIGGRLTYVIMTAIATLFLIATPILNGSKC